MWFITESEGFAIHGGYAVHTDRGDWRGLRHVATFVVYEDAKDYVRRIQDSPPANNTPA